MTAWLKRNPWFEVEVLPHLRAEVARLSPGDVAGYDRFLKDSEDRYWFGFEDLGRRLPYDMPGFLADGKRQMMMQNVPDPVREVMDRHAAKWPGSQSH